MSARALDEFYIDGIQHNVPFLQAVMQNERFQSGKITTAFIAQEFPDGFHGIALPHDVEEKLAAVAAYIHVRDQVRLKEISGQLGKAQPFPRDWVVSFGGQEHQIAVQAENERDIRVALKAKGGRVLAVDITTSWAPGEAVFRGLVAGATMAVQIRRTDDGYRLVHRGASLKAQVMRPSEAALVKLMPAKVAPDTSKFLLCPMPGLLVSVNVELGQEVKAGETLAVVEAMKMENVLRAERDGIISKINAKKGDSLAVDAVILEFA